MAKKRSKNKVKKTSKIQVVSKEVLAPITHRGSLTMQSIWLKREQLLRMLNKTPEQHIKTRPAKGGGDWYYVTGTYVTKVLNFVFGWNWDFIVRDQKIYGQSGEEQIVTLGELVVKDSTGKKQITKTQYGRAEVKYKKDTKKYLDIGNDFKASATDALKKCASMLGIASDVYGREEFREIGEVINDQRELPEVKAEKNKPEAPLFECHECANPITADEVKYSKKIWKKPLCRGCQAMYKKNNW